MSTRRELIVVADDDGDICRFVEVNLRLEGFDVVTVGDGAQALRTVLERTPDLVLLDVMMPSMDGFEVCERLRQDLRTRNTSVIMLTARSMSTDRIVGLTAGADDYIIKPFDPMELVARVKSALRRAREMRAINPLTQLPGNVQVTEEVTRRATTGQEFALMYLDVDNFKSFNDFYSFFRGDEAIKLLARCVTKAVAKHGGAGSFVGHVGGDDFVAVVRPEVAESIATEVIEAWDREVPAMYDEIDRERGYIEVPDRRRRLHRFPLMSVSIGIATTAQRPITSHWTASEIATEMKRFAKREPGSSYAIDRRTDAPGVAGSVPE